MTSQQTDEPIGNPYVGPNTFIEAQRRLFFGRDREARDLTARIVAERLLLFYAQSGAGKSSLLNARVIPALRDGEEFQVLPVGRVSGELPTGVARVDNIYVFNLVSRLDQSGEPPGRLADVTLTDFLARLARETVVGEDGVRSHRWVYRSEMPIEPAEGAAPIAASGPRFVLIIDQFEELITGHPERWEERAGFFRQLNQALLDDPNLWAVLTLREDYVAALDPYAPFMFNRLRARFYMERMGPDAALEAVRRPAKLGGRPFAPGVAEALVNDLRQVHAPGVAGTVTGPYVEPVQLQVVCHELWEATSGETITGADLAKAGDVNEALGSFYDDTLAAVLNPPAVRATGLTERALRQWFENELLTATGIRNTVFRDEGTGMTGSLPNVAVDELARRFLLSTELRGGGAWVELSHDRLAPPVRESNAAWFDANLSMLQRQAALWEAQKRPEGLLLSGEALAEAEAWAIAHEGELVEHEAAYLAACQAARSVANREAQQNRRIRVLAVVAGGVAVLALLATLLALMKTQQAEVNSDKAERAAQRARAGEMAGAAQLAMARPNSDPSHFLLMAQEAISATLPGEPTPGAKLALLDAIAKAPSFVTTLPSRHGGPVRSAAYSPDGARIATASDDGTAKVWDAESGEVMLTLSGHASGVNSAAYSPDGTRIVTAGCDVTDDSGTCTAGAAKVWLLASGAAGDAASQKEPLTLSGHEGRVNSAAYSPDGARIVTASDDGTARVWDAQTGQERRTLTAHAGGVNSAAHSPDGKRIVTAGCDYQNEEGDYCAAGSVRVWDVGSGREVLTIPGHAYETKSAEYSPDGTRIVTAGCDATAAGARWHCVEGTARIWDAATGKELARLGRDTYWVFSAKYSPDGTRIVAASADSVVVSDAANGTELLRFESPYRNGDFYSVAYNPDGTRIVTGSGNGTPKVWDATSGEELLSLGGHFGHLWSVAYSPDGTRILAVNDGTPRVLDARSGVELLALPEIKGLSAAYSPDGWRIVTAGCEAESDSGTCTSGTAKVWDAGSGAALLTLSGHEGRVYSAAYSPDGARIVTASADGTAKVWDAQSGVELQTLRGHTGDVVWASLNPDGSRVVTASYDGTARIWDAESGKKIRSLGEEGGSGLTSAAYSPNRELIVTADDSGVTLWDAERGERLNTLEASEGMGEPRVAFSSDGARILASSYPEGVRVWDEEWDRWHVNESFAGDWYANKVIASAAFSPDGSRIVTGSDDGTMQVWDIDQWRRLMLTEDGCVGSDGCFWVPSAAYRPDGKQIVTATCEHAGDGAECPLSVIKIWDAATRQQLSTLAVLEGYIRGVQYSGDGARIAAISGDGVARLWDADSGEALELSDYGCDRSGGCGVRFLAFSPDGQRIVAGEYDGAARVRDARTGRVKLTLQGLEGEIVFAVYRPDGKRILTVECDEIRDKPESGCDAERIMRVRDAETGEQVGQATPGVWSAAYSPDGQHIAIASSFGDWRVEDEEPGKFEFPLAMPEGNPMIVNVPVVAYSPNGTWIYQTGGDLTGMPAWDSSTGKWVDTLVSRYDSSIASVAFRPPDSRYILTTGYDGTVRIWPTSTEGLVRLASSLVPRDPPRLTKAELADPLLEQPTPTARDQTRRP